MKYVLPLIVASLLFTLPARAGQPATQPQTRSAVAPDPTTPRGALKACDVALPAGGLKAAAAIYHATDADQRKAVAAMAQCDLSATRLEKLVREKFGDAAAQEAIHAMRQVSSADIDAADEKIDDDKATVNWADEREPLDMVKVNGQWKIPVAQLLTDDVMVDDLVEANETVARELDATAREIKAGEYANAYLLARAIRQKMFRVLGEDE